MRVTLTQRRQSSTPKTVRNEVHLGSDHMHQRRWLNEQLYALVCHQLVELALAIRIIQCIRHAVTPPLLDSQADVFLHDPKWWHHRWHGNSTRAHSSVHLAATNTDTLGSVQRMLVIPLSTLLARGRVKDSGDTWPERR